MDSEKFRNISEGVKNVVMAGAIFGAAAWAYYEFVVTGAAQTAREEYVNLVRANHQFADISILLSAEPVRMAQDDSVHLMGTVEIKNLGNRLALVDLSPETWPLILSKVTYSGEEGLFLFEELNRFRFARENRTMTARISLNSGQTHRLPFALPIGGAGLYMLTFSSTAVPEDNQLPQKTTSGVEISPVHWFRQELVNVDSLKWERLVSPE